MPATPFPAAGVAEQPEELLADGGDDVASVVPTPESPLPDTPGSWQRVAWREADLVDDGQVVPEPPNLLADWVESSVMDQSLTAM